MPVDEDANPQQAPHVGGDRQGAQAHPFSESVLPAPLPAEWVALRQVYRELPDHWVDALKETFSSPVSAPPRDPLAKFSLED